MRKGYGLVACVLGLLLAIGIGYAPGVSAQGGLSKIADDVYAYVDVKRSGPQNSFGANAGVIVGRDAIVVVDTLISAKEANRFIRDIRAISDKPIKYVVNTHYHLDHSFGNCEFQKLGAVIISQDNDKANARVHNAAALKNAQQYGLSEQDLAGTTIVYPDLSFSDRMEIDLGSQRVQLIYPKASHTDGSLLVYLPDKKILFAGDILFTNYHPFMANGNIKSWTKVLDGILKMDADTIIPGHGPVSTKKDVRDMKQYLIAFDRKAKQLSAKSKDLDVIVAEMKKSMPPRAEAEWLIKANIQMGYLKK